MTALGINVSDRDAVSDWTYIKPHQKSPLEIEHINAMNRLDELNKAYVRDVDSWVEKRNELIELGNIEIVRGQEYHKRADEYFAEADAIWKEKESRWSECEEAEDLVHSLYKRLNCDHHFEDMGGMHSSGGEVWDDIHPVCIKCGLEE